MLLIWFYNPSRLEKLIYLLYKNWNKIHIITNVRNLKMEDRLSHFSFVRLFVTLCTVASQDPLSMGFSRQECWSGLPCSPPGDLPGGSSKPGTKPMSLMFPALAGRFFTTSATWEAQRQKYAFLISFILPFRSYCWQFGVYPYKDTCRSIPIIFYTCKENI